MARLAIKPLSALAALLLPLCSPTVAQTTPDPPGVISPLKVEPDRNGVNLNTGKINNLAVPSLGVPAAPRLRWDRVQNSAPYMQGTITGSGAEVPQASYSVHTDAAASESFRCPDYDCTSTTLSGSTFFSSGTNHQNGQYRRAGSGEVYHFTETSSNSVTGSTRTVQAYASKIDYADGETVTFTYNTATCGGATCYRPTRIATNVGYFITVTYPCSDVALTCWGTPLDAKLFADSDTVNPIQSLNYSGATITDIGGRQWQITGAANALGVDVESLSATIKLPAETSNAVTTAAAANANLVGSFVRDGVTWTYAYTNPVPNPNAATSYYYTKLTATGPNGYSMSYDMDPAYQNVVSGYLNIIAKSTDALGRQTNYDYDAGTRLTKLTLPEGNYTQLGWDGCGNITQRTSVDKSGSANIVESAVYPNDASCLGLGVRQYRPTSYTDGLSRVTDYVWNDNGQLTEQTDPPDVAGVRRRTRVVYTLTGTLSRKTSVQVCDSTLPCSNSYVTRTDYTYWGNTFLPLTAKQFDLATGDTRTTTYNYDSAGRTWMIDGPLPGTGDATYFQYDVFGRKIWEVGELAPNGKRLAKKYSYRDSDDKVFRVNSGTVSCATDCNVAALALNTLNTLDTSYDSRRYPVRDKLRLSTTTYTVTDRSFLDRGLPECAAARMNLAALPTIGSHAACTLGTTGSDGPDRITKNFYDNAGQLLKVQKAFGVTTANGFPKTLQQDYVTYTYTANGKQEYVTDANGNKARFVYDGFDRLYQWQFPSKTTPGVVNTADFEQYGYDAAGNRTSLRKRDASTLTFVYDGLDRVVTKIVPERSGLDPMFTRDVFYRYDIAGRQTRARFDSVSGDGVTNTYDGFGGLLTSQLGMAGFSRVFTSTYDAAGRRDSLAIQGATFNYAYDNLGRMSSLSEGANLLDSFAYADNGLLATRGESSGTTASSAGYSWDDIGRLTGQTDAFTAAPASNVAWTFGISPASQITNETRDNDSYAFTGIAASSKAYVPNGLNQYASVGGATLLYDSNGNLTSDPGAGTGGATYVYDVENRLVQATNAGVTATLTYDPLGRLYQLVKGAANTRFFHDGDALVTEYDSAGAILNRYAHGSNVAADDPLVWFQGSTLTNKRYLHADRLGSIVAATNGASAPAINAYDEYGVPKSGNVGRFQYTGQVWLGEIGLYYYKARVYSPYLGRFLQVDPIGYDDQINLYAYVGNDPVNASDPSGEAGFDQTDCTGSRLCNGEGLSSGRSGSSDISATGRVEGGNTRRTIYALDGDTAMTRQMSRDDQAALSGDMSKEEYMDRAGARGIGVAVGAATLATRGLILRSLTRGGSVAAIAKWLGPKFTARTLPSGNRVFQSADGLRRFRIDFVQTGRGTFRGPHAQFEVRGSVHRPFQPAPGIPKHIYFRGN